MTARSCDAIAFAVLGRFRAGDEFGLLLTGDPHYAEETFRTLAADADIVIGHAEAVDGERLAALGPAHRVLALAWDPADVHPALLRRCTAVLRFPGRHDANLAITQPAQAALPLALAVVVERSVLLLHAAGLHDHGLDIATVRLAQGLVEAADASPLEVIRRVVVAPRTTDRDPTSPDPTDGSDEAADDDTVSAAEPDVDASAGGAGDTDDASDGSEPDGDQEGRSDPSGDPGPDADGEDEQQEGSGDEPSEPGLDETPGAGEAARSETGDAPAEAGGQPEPLSDEQQAPHTSPDGEGAGQQHSMTAADYPPGHPDGDTDAHVAVDAAGDTMTGFTTIAVVPATVTRPAEAPLDSAPRPRAAKRHFRGRSGPRIESSDRGRISRTMPYNASHGIAIAPTLLRAARRTVAEIAAGVYDPTRLVRDDLRSARRRRRGGVHTVIVVDGSSSLGRDGLLRAGSLTDQLVASVVARRGVVSVVVASGEHSTTVSSRSTNLHRTRDALRRASTGGGTPLADGLLRALDILDNDDRTRRRVVVVTDGRPTVDLAGRVCDERTAVEELEQVLARVAARVSDLTMLPVGIAPGRRFELDTASFRAAGARIL